MKKITISIAMLVGLNGFSQMIERKKLAEGKSLLGSKWQIEMNIENNKDTTTYFYYGYQNMRYSYITDIGSIYFIEKNGLIEFSEALKTLASKENGSNIELKIGKYSVRLYDFSNNIYIEDENNKYNIISKKSATKMANEILENVNLLRK